MELKSFKSTAEFYSRFRVPYPGGLIAQLEKDANLNNTCVVLDVATGPGRLALRLAPIVGKVLAIDIDAEMLREGAAKARALSLKNVQWVQARAESHEIEADSVDLVTIGEAIHRLDQDLVLGHIRNWLTSSGCVAIAGCYGILHGSQPWQDSLRHAVKRWTSQMRQDDSRRWRGEDHDTARLMQAGFQDVVNRSFSIPHVWTRESILGNLHSTSQFSISALGEQIGDFDKSVMISLEAYETDQFPQTIPCGYTIGWKNTQYGPEI
ncbi:MAG: class I SAM-dependent methyltransferase [Gammaproteobacteria bacterium]|nr:class I SAM-dependent methyltransferase [Gammaproteobacteria bacterium]MYD80231.1 class I SAM-dependent methyltransferase [Gammaproteobacteria bacterium]